MSRIVLPVLSRCETDQCSREMIASSTPKPNRYDGCTSLLTRCHRLVRTIFPIIFIRWKVQATGLRWLGFLGCAALGTGPTRGLGQGYFPQEWNSLQTHPDIQDVQKYSTELICTVLELMPSGPMAFLILSGGVGLWCDSCWEQIKITRIKKGTQRPDQTRWDHPNINNVQILKMV